MKKGGKWPYILITAFCAVLGALGQLMFKIGAVNVTYSIFSWILNPYVILGVVFYGLATIIFIMILKKAELSLLYPVVATSYIWVALLSIFVVKEAVSMLNWLGFALIIGGVALTSIKRESKKRGHAG